MGEAERARAPIVVRIDLAGGLVEDVAVEGTDRAVRVEVDGHDCEGFEREDLTRNAQGALVQRSIYWCEA